MRKAGEKKAAESNDTEGDGVRADQEKEGGPRDGREAGAATRSR